MEFLYYCWLLRLVRDDDGSVDDYDEEDSLKYWDTMKIIHPPRGIWNRKKYNQHYRSSNGRCIAKKSELYRGEFGKITKNKN